MVEGQVGAWGWYPPSQVPEKPRRRYIYPLNVWSSPPVLLLPFPVCPVLTSSLVVFSERELTILEGSPSLRTNHSNHAGHQHCQRFCRQREGSD
jgi:hypothetical protein